MLHSMDDRTQAAISRLNSNDDFARVCTWLNQNYAELRNQLMAEHSDLSVRRLQGATLLLHDLLNQVMQL